MNIDSRLVSFQTNIKPNLSTIESSKNSLISDIESLKSINTSVSSSLSTSFKGEGADAVTPEIEYLNQATSKISQSIESELAPIIARCQKLSLGIDELQKILDEYNKTNSIYQSLDEDDKNKSSMAETLKTLKTDFTNKQNELVTEHDAIKNQDGSLSVLSEYGKTDSNLPTGFTAMYDGVEFSSIYYHKDGVVYQKIVPICKDGQAVSLNETYTIIYNTANITAAAGNNEYTQKLFDYLNAKLANQKTDAYLWDYSTKKYGSKTNKAVSTIMDQILKDTYEANNASTISDYASLAAMVANNSVVHFGYGGNGKQGTYGYSGVLEEGGDLDCIGFVRWCYSQGLFNTGVVSPGEKTNNLLSNGSSMSPLNILAHHSYEIADMNMSQRENIPVGSVLSRACYDGNGNIYNYHVGIVIGHTTDENGKPALVVAQSSNTTIGANNRVYPLDELASSKNKWSHVSTPELMTIRVTQGSHKGSTWVV